MPQRDFLWGWKATGRKRAWNISKPKEQGGLGIKDIRLAKWKWGLATVYKGLWGEILESNGET